PEEDFMSALTDAQQIELLEAVREIRDRTQSFPFLLVRCARGSTIDPRRVWAIGPGTCTWVQTEQVLATGRREGLYPPSEPQEVSYTRFVEILWAAGVNATRFAQENGIEKVTA